ncbi:MAG: hypothetical protein L6290_04490 [Thermodesulfovibrionales bacterium]|nr:hypothetical protein [Thermodesulfovibrionales bacterium]
MKYIEAIKDGFRLINRNWQLVLIQVGMIFTIVLAFFIIVGIPLAIAFIIFGIDLTTLTSVENILQMFRGTSDLLSKYLGLIFMVLASFVVYFLAVAMLEIYVFSGSVGVIGRSVLDEDLKFSVRIFMEEAKRLFLRLIGFTSVMGIIFIIASFFLGLLVGGIAAIISFAQSQDSTLALFFGIFFSLILIILLFTMILGILSITLYGIAALFFKGTGVFKSVSGAIKFLKTYPNGFWLSSVLFVGHLVASFLLSLLVYPFTFIPLVGPIFSFPYQLVSIGFQTYLGLVIIAIVLIYYYRKEFPAEPAAEISEKPMQEPFSEEGNTTSETEAQENA